MHDAVITVEEASRELRLHPKTVLRMIREGRLAAVSVGKSYRIRQADVDALAGLPPPSHPQARATCAVTVSGIEVQKAGRVVTALQAGLTHDRGPGSDPIQLQSAYDSERRELTVFVVAVPADAAALLSAIGSFLEEPSS